MEDYIFLDFDRVTRLNKLAIKAFGGSDLVRDQEVIESAISQPKVSFDGKYLHQGVF